MLTKDKYKKGRGEGWVYETDALWHYYFTVTANETHKGNVLFLTFEWKNNELLQKLRTQVPKSLMMRCPYDMKFIILSENNNNSLKYPEIFFPMQSTQTEHKFYNSF